MLSLNIKFVVYAKVFLVVGDRLVILFFLLYLYYFLTFLYMCTYATTGKMLENKVEEGEENDALRRPR